MANSTCDVSTIFSGGGPNNAGASVIVGGKQLIPSPFISVSLEKYKVGELTIGGVLKVTLNGTVVGSSFNEVVNKGANDVTGLKDILQLGQYRECVYVEIGCSNYIVKGYGRITSLSIPEGNMPTWVNMAQYTIEIDLYTNDIGLGSGIRPAFPGQVVSSGSGLNILDNLMLNNLSEQFSLSINDDAFSWAGSGLTPMSGLAPPALFGGWGSRHVKVNFNITAGGIRGLTECNQSGSLSSIYGSGTTPGLKYGLDAAETYIIGRLDTLRSLSGVNVFDPASKLSPALLEYSGGLSFLDFRNIDINPLENTITIGGEIIYRPSGCGSTEGKVFSNLNIDQNIDPEGETITLNGSIQGLVNSTYTDIIKVSGYSDCTFSEKINNAEAFLNFVNKPTNWESIANKYKSDTGYLTDTCPFSTTSGTCSGITPSGISGTLCDFRLTSAQINRNLAEGEINFTFILSNKPNCNTFGTYKIDVEINHDRPKDNIVEFIIPGRGNTLIQNLCCQSPEKYDISVNASINRNNCNFSMPTGTINQLRSCASGVLNNLQNDIGVDFRCWFKTNDQEAIGNNTYRLNRSYVKPSCP